MLYLLMSDIESEYGVLNAKSLIKSVFNPSLHACLLVRLSSLTTGILHVVIRNILIIKHSIDAGSGAKIGKGLKLPHPFNLVIGRGAVIGDNVTLYHGVTIGDKDGYPVICDDVIVYPNSVLVGRIRVGKKCIIGAGVFLNKNLADSDVYKG